MLKLIKKIKEANKLMDTGPIFRRYFAMNGFDGCLTSLGVIVGFFIAGIDKPLAIILTALSTAFALFISGFSSAYFTEKAERLQEIKALEKKMLHSLKESSRVKAMYVVSLEAALIDGLSPSIMTLIILFPFVLSLFHLIPLGFDFYYSISIALILLFLLGFYLGKISEQNKFALGFKMLLAGILSLVISLLLGGLT